MLPDPLIIGVAAETSDTTPSVKYTMPVVKDARTGLVLREITVGNLKRRLAFSTVETKENKPLGTVRTKIRVEEDILNYAGDVTLTMFGEVTFGLPKDTNVDPTSLNSIRRVLGQLLLYGDGVTSADLANGDALASRYLAGEL
jgi:hypothetical protein